MLPFVTLVAFDIETTGLDPEKEDILELAGVKFTFERMGKCGTWANTDILPYTARIVDDIAVVKTVHTDAINHDPACTFVMTGSEVPGKASLGSWLSYGLGAESNDLPAFVVLTPNWKSKAAAQALFTRMWSSGFLPTKYTGVALRSIGDPVVHQNQRRHRQRGNATLERTHARWLRHDSESVGR